MPRSSTPDYRRLLERLFHEAQDWQEALGEGGRPSLDAALKAAAEALKVKRPWTVVFYVDDRFVETFVQRVMAVDEGAAWEAAIRKARRDGGSSSGHGVSSFANATEIATFPGHV